MSTSCQCVDNIPDFCLFSGDSEDKKPVDKEKAIEAYTRCIDESKKCLNFTENPVSREKL